MLRAMVVDDEILMLEDAVEHLKYAGVFVAAEFTRPKQALSWFREHFSEVDVVFLDVVMPVLNGFDLAEIIQNIKPDIPVVFISGYDQYAIQAFEMAALDYVQKPLTCERMDKVLQRIFSTGSVKSHENDSNNALSKLLRDELWEKRRLRSVMLKNLSGEHSNEVLLYKNGNWKWIKRSAVIAFKKEKSDKYVQVMTVDERYETMEPLKDFFSYFQPDNWLVCYRAVYVRINAVEKVVKSKQGEVSLQMKNSKCRISVSRNYLDNVIMALNRR